MCMKWYTSMCVVLKCHLAELICQMLILTGEHKHNPQRSARVSIVCLRIEVISIVLPTDSFRSIISIEAR